MADSERAGDAAIIASLIAGRGIAHTAETLGISESTIRRRLKDERFRGELAEARREVVEAATAQLTRLAEAALVVLAELLRSSPPSVRLGAVKVVLASLHEWGQSEDLARKVAELEQRAGIDPETGWRLREAS